MCNRRALGKYAYLAMGWICLLIVTAPIYYVVKAGYGDALYFESLATDLFKNGGRWSGWALSAAPVYFPDMIFTFINFFIFDYATDKLFALTIIDIACIVWATEYFLHSFNQPRSLNASFIVLLLMSIISYCVYTTGIYLYAHSSNAHIGTWILSFFCLGLTLRFLNSGRRSQLFWLIALSMFGFINDNLFLVSYTAPAFVTVMGIFLLIEICGKTHPARKPLLLLLVLLPVSYVAAQCLQPFLFNYPQLSSRMPMNMLGLLRTWQHFLEATHDLTTGKNPWFCFIFVLWIIGFASCMAYSVRATWRYLCEAEKPADLLLYFATTFTPIAVLCNVGGVFLSGVAQDATMYRYFEIAMILPVLMLFPLANKYYRTTLEARPVKAICLAISIVVSAYFLMNFDAQKPRPLTINQVRNFDGIPEKKLAECLDDNKEKYNLQYGLADFWSVATTNLFSQKGIRVALVNGPWHVQGAFNFDTHGWILDQRHYLSNIDWDMGNEGSVYAKPFYNFIIVNSGFTEEAIVQQATAGMEPISFACPPEAYIFGQPTTILVYSPDSGFNELIYQKAIASHAAYDFKMEKSDSITYSGAVLPTTIGVIKNNAMNARAGKTKTGLLTFGPIIQLPKGHYKATIIYSSPDSTEGQIVGTWDVFGNERTLANGDITATNGEGKITTSFDIITREESKFFMQVRTAYYGNGNLSIQSLTLERIKNAK